MREQEAIPAKELDRIVEDLTHVRVAVAMGGWDEVNDDYPEHTGGLTAHGCRSVVDAIDSLLARLRSLQVEQEPVAWMVERQRIDTVGELMDEWTTASVFHTEMDARNYATSLDRKTPRRIRPLVYASPSPRAAAIQPPADRGALEAFDRLVGAIPLHLLPEVLVRAAKADIATVRSALALKEDDR